MQTTVTLEDYLAKLQICQWSMACELTVGGGHSLAVVGKSGQRHVKVRDNLNKEDYLESNNSFLSISKQYVFFLSNSESKVDFCIDIFFHKGSQLLLNQSLWTKVTWTDKQIADRKVSSISLDLDKHLGKVIKVLLGIWLRIYSHSRWNSPQLIHSHADCLRPLAAWRGWSPPLCCAPSSAPSTWPALGSEQKRVQSHNASLSRHGKMKRERSEKKESDGGQYQTPRKPLN